MSNIASIAAGLLTGLISPQQHSHGDPTNDEQYVLETMNRARFDPFGEGLRLGIDPREGLEPAEAERVGRRPPLAFNLALLEAARAHSRDMHRRSFFDHVNPDLLDPGMRAANAGYFGSRVGENIAAGSNPALHSSAQLHDLLVIDATVEGRGHRKHILDVSATDPPVYREVGIGYAAFPEPNAKGFRAFLTEEFGRRSVGPFLLGVVFHDANRNGFYDPGEGIPGVEIRHDRGSSWAATSSSGGYACSVGTHGTVTVTPSGGGVPWPASVVKKARLEGENVKVDFTTSDASDTDSDGMPDAWETRYGFNPGVSSDADLDSDGDEMTNLEEFQYSTAPNDPASRLGSAPAAPPFTPAPADSGDEDSSCGSGGLDLLLVLAVLLARRHRRIVY